VSARIGLFEQADGGTIFLDEIAETSPAFQVKLLRVLQEREVRPIGANRRRQVDVRVVAATNRDLELEIREGRFRADLYYRLAGVRVHLPPLRERSMDIPAIALRILDEARHLFAKSVDDFSDEALACLAAYRWPGNVRELQNEVQRLVVLADGPTVGAELLDRRILQAATAVGLGCSGASSEGRRADGHGDGDLSGTRPRSGLLKDRVEALEAQVLREALIRHRWNKTQAADELGLSRVGLRSKMERYGLIPSGGDPDGVGSD
jgi:two-component system response regulator HupR/HoxA